MAFSAFDDSACPPNPDALPPVLGPTVHLWSELLARALPLCAPSSELWTHGGARSGWSLRLKQGDRVILYLTPHVSSFSVGVVLGERASQAALSATLPTLAREALEAAPRYAEGRGVRIAVSAPSHVEAVLALLPHKLATPSRPSRPSRKARPKPARA